MTIDLDPAANPFLHGLMAPVAAEHDATGLRVEGEVPAGLRGVFVRNGPDPRFTPPGKYHPFDGDGMLHGVYLDEGGASYRNRWIASQGLAAEERRGHAVYGGLSEFVMPDADVVAEAGLIKNTANTHTVRHAGRWLALMEACPPTEFTRDLATVGEHDFGGALVGGMTAHPKVDPVTGELLFFGYSPFPPYLRAHRVDPSGALVQTVEIDLPAPVMIHDFVVTEHHLVFLDSPAVFDVESMMAGGPAMRWEPGNGTRLGVLPRGGGADDVRWFEIDTCYVVHFFNAWDDGAQIHVHAPAFERMPGAFEFDAPGGGADPAARRWTIDLELGTVATEQLDDRAAEFPRINDDVATRQHRYAYSALLRTSDLDFDFSGVVRYDLDTGGAEELLYGESEVCGEHVFAPDPAGSAEDDGWLLTMVTDREEETSWLSIADARDLSAGPVAKVHIPWRVPLGFHANWFADA